MAQFNPISVFGNEFMKFQLNFGVILARIRNVLQPHDLGDSEMLFMLAMTTDYIADARCRSYIHRNIMSNNNVTLIIAK